MTKQADLCRRGLQPRNSRSYPGAYSPVIVMEQGRRVLEAMRHQCRPSGKPAFHDTKFPCTYNARRDSFGKSWKPQFGYPHGLMVADTFFENVEGPDGNRVPQFTPRNNEPMFVACLSSHWTDDSGEGMSSFAAITDEREPEVAAAGHDRTTFNIKPKSMDA